MDMHSGAISLQEASQNDVKPKDKRTQWQEHMERWQSSGLTQADYCGRNGLKLSTFRYWRKRLATADTPVTLVPVGFSRDGSASSSKLHERGPVKHRRGAPGFTGQARIKKRVCRIRS